MIKNSNDQTITPRIKAQDIIMDALASARGYWTEGYHGAEEMTDREIALVNEQLQKEADRIAKRFKFDHSWVN